MPAVQKVLLHLFVASGAISVTPAVAGAVRPQILVLFRNDARAEQGLVDSAKAEVTRLYALIDVDLIWVTEVPLRKNSCTSSVSSSRNLMERFCPNPRWVSPRRDGGIGVFWPMCFCGGSSARPRDSKRESISSLR